jgi:hypothetical protein
LESLIATCNVSEAASAAKTGRTTVYEWRETDPVFAAAWDAALEEAVDALEAEVRRRAVEGVEEPIYYQGQRVGMVRRYSDILLMFYLKRYRPQFRDQFKVEHSGMSLEELVAGSREGACSTCGGPQNSHRPGDCARNPPRSDGAADRQSAVSPFNHNNGGHA